MTTSSIHSMYPQDGDFAALQEMREAALQSLPGEVIDFVESGSGRETTLRANLAAFERRIIRPRPMSGVSMPRTSTTFRGIPLAVPLLTAPFGGDALFHPDGHLAVARANELCGSASVVPEIGTYSYEQLAEVAPAAARIAQLHPFEHFDHEVERVEKAGYAAICLTVDCPTAGFRVRNRVNRFDPDLSYFGGNLGAAGVLDIATMFERLFRHDAPASDWGRLADATLDCGIPCIANGILTAESAEQAIAAGASAIIVSNHGGCQLDPAPATLDVLDVLPEVIRAVAERIPIALDSGVRSGSDMFLALALGADVIVIGRLAIYGVAAAGKEGVRRTIELLTEELRTLMIIAGVPSIDAFDPSLVADR